MWRIAVVGAVLLALPPLAFAVLHPPAKWRLPVLLVAALTGLASAALSALLIFGKIPP